MVGVVLAIPIVPFALFGQTLEEEMEQYLDRATNHSVVALLVVGLLAVDVFLPVPSSVVSTFAGKTLGFLAGTGASWLGMTLGAVVAFAIARTLGRPAALWLSGEADLARTDVLSRRWGPTVLVITRPVPVLAEAAVLFLGTTDLPWRRFVLPIALGNLGIAGAYSALGNWVRLPAALAASIALPLMAAIVARWLWPRHSDARVE